MAINRYRRKWMGLFANGPSLLPGRDMPTVTNCPVVVAGYKTAGLRWRHLHWVYWRYAKRGRTNVCGNQLISAECNWQLAQFCRWRQTGCLHGTTHSLSRCWSVLWGPVYVGINKSPTHYIITPTGCLARNVKRLIRVQWVVLMNE